MLSFPNNSKQPTITPANSVIGSPRSIAETWLGTKSKPKSMSLRAMASGAAFTGVST